MTVISTQIIESIENSVKKRRPGRAFMVPADWFASDEYDALVDGLRAESANSAVVGWFRAQARAKQRNSGTFPSEAALRAALGHYARWLPRYRAFGLLDGLTIADWDLWQQDSDGGASAREQARRQRDRDRKRRDRLSADTASLGASSNGVSPLAQAVTQPPTPRSRNRRNGTLQARLSVDGPRISTRGEGDGEGIGATSNGRDISPGRSKPRDLSNLDFKKSATTEATPRDGAEHLDALPQTKQKSNGTASPARPQGTEAETIAARQQEAARLLAAGGLSPADEANVRRYLNPELEPEQRT